MGMLILSESIESRNVILTNVLLASIDAGLSFSIDESESKKLLSDETMDLILKKRRNGNIEESLILGLDSEEEIVSFSEHLNIKIKGKKCYRLAVTEDANFDHLIYDFALCYLKLQPSHCISLYGDSFFFLEDIKNLESNGGYCKGWCFKPAS